MWNDHRYNDLLERIEAQYFERQQNRRKPELILAEHRRPSKADEHEI